MKNIYQYTPSGTRDYLFEECKIKRETEAKLSASFGKAGFSEVITPLIEYYDVFNQTVNTNSQQEMYKLIDNSGRILVLRPDSTLPIARMVGTRLRDGIFPLKLHYTQNVYRNHAGAHGKRNELTQSGVELIGANGLKADVEVIITAIHAFSDCGLTDIKIELGHVGFFKALISSIPFKEEDMEKIRNDVEYKNFAALNDILDEYHQYEAAQNLRMLPQLFGGSEVFEMALSIGGGEEASAIIHYLMSLYNILREMGYQNVISVDLGLVHHLNYYTGLVFRGYINGSGETVLSGGRYDSLLSSFGMNLPATGFAINVDEAVQIISAKRTSAQTDCKELVFCQQCHLAKAAVYLLKIRAEGANAQLSLFDTLEESLAYASKTGIQKVTVISDENYTVFEV